MRVAHKSSESNESNESNERERERERERVRVRVRLCAGTVGACSLSRSSEEVGLSFAYTRPVRSPAGVSEAAFLWWPEPRNDNPNATMMVPM